MMDSVLAIAWVGVGSALGGMMRYAMTLGFERWMPSSFPLARNPKQVLQIRKSVMISIKDRNQRIEPLNVLEFFRMIISRAP